MREGYNLIESMIFMGLNNQRPKFRATLASGKRGIMPERGESFVVCMYKTVYIKSPNCMDKICSLVGP